MAAVWVTRVRSSYAATLFAKPSEKMWWRLRSSYQQDSDGAGQIINIMPTALGDTCGARFVNKGYNLAGTKQGFNISLPYFCGRIPTLKQLGESIVSTKHLVAAGVARLGRRAECVWSTPSSTTRSASNFGTTSRSPTASVCVANIFMTNLQGNYEFENGISIGLNIGYDDTRAGLILDSDRSNIETSFQFVPQITTTRSYEVRVRSAQDQRLRWLVGAHALQRRSHQQLRQRRIGRL